MKHKSLVIVILLLLGVASGLYGQWMYSKDAIVNQTTNAGTDYQIRFIVHYGAGTDSGEDVYLNGNCRTDFGDIRFFEGAVELSYWMESMTTSSTAVFWVKLAGNLDTGALAVTLQYGNPAVTTTSNGDDTFLFFDDFSGDLSKWTRHKVVGVYPQISGGYVRCGGGTTTAGANTYGHTVLGSSASYAAFQNNAIEYRYKMSANTIGEVGFRGVFGTDTGYKTRNDNRAATPGNNILIHPYYYNQLPLLSWAEIANPYAGGAFTVDQWYRGTLTAYQSSLKSYRNGTLTNSATDATYAGAGEISLQNHFGTYSDYDWVAVRKFAGAEPTRGSWGGEITLAAELSSFTAVLTAEYFVKLHWTTQSETGVSGFYIYRGLSSDVSEALAISPMVDATNTTDVQHYEYTDNELFEAATYYYWLVIQDMDGGVTYHGPTTVYYDNSSSQGAPGIPVVSGLQAIYPNPFNPTATIGYGLNKAATVDFTIYNTRGQIVRTFSEGQKDAGNWKVTWNGMDNNGNSCSTGVYYIKMQAGKDSFMRKAVMMK